MILIDSFTASV